MIIRNILIRSIKVGHQDEGGDYGTDDQLLQVVDLGSAFVHLTLRIGVLLLHGLDLISDFDSKSAC